jgi:hypothetical protein
MPKNDATPEGRSQKLLSPDMVMIDRKTCHELNKLIGNCIDQVQNIRHCEIMLTSLEYHLSELADDRARNDEFEIGKGILLLRYWLNVVPKNQTELSGWLQKAFETLQVVLAASQLGGDGNE